MLRPTASALTLHSLEKIFYLAVLGLCCCVGFSLAVVSAWASHCGGLSCQEHRLSSVQASVISVWERPSCSCPAACGILPDQGTSPLPALAGRFFTTEPPGKPSAFAFSTLTLSLLLDSAGQAQVKPNPPSAGSSTSLVYLFSYSPRQLFYIFFSPLISNLASFLKPKNAIF